MNFVALDVETANPDISSICQVGIAVFENGHLKDTWCSLINPVDFFDPWNTRIHRITAEMVIDAPYFKDILPIIERLAGDRPVIHHGPFDRIAISRASAKCGMGMPELNWLDSSRIARKAWEKFSNGGFGLKNLSCEFGITFKHHDALEDAICAGKVVIKAIGDTGISIDEWITISKQPSGTGKISINGNPAGHLAGENIVFTGKLSIPRKEAATLAAEAGCNVLSSVNSNTTILVVGMQDLRLLNGNTKSSKQIKAERLIEQGVEIKIICEEDLLEMVKSRSSSSA